MKKYLWITVLIILMLTLFCMPALADGNHPVTMTVNGSTGASQTVTVNSRNLLTIQAPGATAIRVLNPNRWHSNEEDIETADCWDYYDDRGWNTEYLEIYQVFEFGTSFVYAEARYDDHQGNIRDWDGEGDSPWTGVSQRISLTLTNNGQSLAVPSVTMSPAGSVTRGDWLTLSIDNPQGKGEWYWADLDRVYGDGNTEFLNHFDFNSDYDMAIHTDKYEAGSYRLRIYACAAGYADHSHIEKEFTITGSGSTSAFLKVSKTSATVGEEIFISAFAPNENQLRVEMTKQGDPSWFERREWGGSYAQNRWNIDQPGTYVLSLIVNGQAVDTKTVTFAGGTGTLSKPNLSGMPATVTKGQAYSGTFTVDDYAEWVDVNVEYMPDQGNRTKIYQSNRKNTDANFTKLNLPASVISRAGRYKVDVHTRATGYEDSNTGFVFLVKEADSGTQTLTLTVNGSTDDILSWPSSSNVHIQVQGEGATAIRLLRDENWEDVEGWTSGTVHWNKGFGAGDHILIAQMTTDEPIWRADNFDWSKFNWNTDVNWTTLSNPVKIHVASQGRLAEPQVTLKVGSNTLNPNNATVTRGDVLTVTAAQQDHAEWIQAEFRILQDDDGGRWWNGIQNGYFASNGQGLTMQIPTAGIPAGSYYLQVGVEGVNWEGSYVYLPLTVVDPEGGVVEPGLEFSRESVQTNETVNILAWAPDAWRMELDISMDGDNNWRDRRETDRDSASWNWECGLGGEYNFTLNYFMPGENGPRTITKKLTVISDGVMDQPVLTGIPDLLYLGNGIQGSFMAVSGAEWYNVGVRYSYNGYNWDDIVNENRNPDQSGATDLNFDKNIFDQEGIYRIWVSANAVGKDNGCTERQIQVIDGSNINENLVLRVNGQTDGSKVNEVYLHMEPEVSVSAPSGVTAVRMINTTSNWQYRLPDQNGMAYCNLGVHQGGYVVFRAQATTDEEVTDWADEHNGDMYGFDWDSVEWSMSSLPVTINVIYFGDLEDPEVTFTSGTVERGDMLEFTISPVEHSDYYGYRVRKVLENGLSDYILDNDLSMTEPTTIQIPTDALTAGTYRLDVDPRHYGWHGNESSYTFTVTETTPSTAAVFTTRKYAVLTQETMYFSIYAPGASRVKLCHEKEAIVWSETQGETMVRMVIPNRVRTYHVMAYALYPNENNWTQIGTTLEITVTAPNGTLPDPVITAPNSVLKDEDGVLIAMLTCDYLGTYGQAECWLSSQENEEEYELEQFGRQMNPDGTYTEMFRIDTARLDPGTYTLEAFAIPGAPGYAMGQNTATVTVTQNSGIQATLTADKRILEIFEDVCLNVNAGNSATAIALYSNGEWIYESGASMTEYATAWWEGEMTFFAYYTTEALPNNDSWQNPAWAGWTGISNIVTVQINPPTQELDLDITVAKTTVQQGEQFKVIITNHNTNLNPSYGATLQKLEESGQFGSSSPWYGPDQEGSNIILVDTRNMQPGNYLLHITANAVGCRGVLEDVNVHITEAVSTLILPSGLTVIEEEAFAGIAAQKIIVPDGVTTIEARAFASCPNLEEIVLPADISSFAGDAFAGCTHQIKTYGSADSYLADYAANVDKLVLVPEE